MKRGIAIVLSLVVSLVVAGGASAKIMHTADCVDLLYRCDHTAGLKHSQCQSLYDAAVKSGAWGLPDARAASKTTGGSTVCR